MIAPSWRLHCTVCFLRVNRVNSPSQDALVNSNWYPEYATIHPSAPNPHLAQFPVEFLHLMPASLCHSLACLAFTHRARRSSPRADYAKSIQIPARILYHRGLAIKALSDDIGNVKIESNDAIIAGVFTFLISEVSSFCFILRRLSAMTVACFKQVRLFESTWRQNFQGATELIKLRGGFEHLSRSSVSLQPVLLGLLM